MTSSSRKKKKKKERKRNIQVHVGRTQETGPEKLGNVLNKNVFSLLFPVQSIYMSSVCKRILSLLIMKKYDLIILVSNEKK